MKINAESWTNAFRTTFICLSVLTIALAVAYTLALFYLYSFDHDPKNWTNVVKFYARDRLDSAGLGSLVVRGTGGAPVYATRYELGLGEFKPSALHDCLLAAEDKRFYGHAGVDYISFLSAVTRHLIGGRRLRGASTITNQLMGEVILADRSRTGLRGLWRKFEEIILTNAAESHFSKDDLLLAYVNNVPVGHLNGRALIGLSAATDAIFGKKNPKALTLSEACTLVGMLNRPNRYIREALKSDYGSITKRRNFVLDNLRSENPHHYSQEAIERAKSENVKFFKNNARLASEPRQLIAYAYQQLPEKKSGLRVYLTLEPDLQRAAEVSVKEELDRFDRGPYGFYNRLSYEHALREGHKVKREDAKLQAALVALDAKTGDILALVGGRNSSGEFNRATQAKRAPGSAIKPFLYLCAVTSGLNGRPFGPDTIIDPANSPAAQRYSTGGAASAVVQLARSDNGAAVTIVSKLGISLARNCIANLTGTNPAETELIAIGAGKGMELSPLDLAAAYTVFPNNGVKVAPTPIRAIDDGVSTEASEAQMVRIVRPGAPLVVARMLQAVVGHGPEGQYGTARMVRKISGLDATVPLAGKTGTAGDNDLWFVGFTPRLVVVVWVGFDNNYPPLKMSEGFTGSGLPLRIWGRFMRDVKKYQGELLKGSF
jgi:membrane peptidoglycan carboxypeptidase